MGRQLGLYLKNAAHLHTESTSDSGRESPACAPASAEDPERCPHQTRRRRSGGAALQHVYTQKAEARRVPVCGRYQSALSTCDT